LCSFSPRPGPQKAWMIQLKVIMMLGLIRIVIFYFLFRIVMKILVSCTENQFSFVEVLESR
jgi:hypothetical protein